ncbi:MAG TPA: hypothetical protein VK783_04015 [Bacteroidia bacterium]|jgi:hypothetical protein|nr:hypothetical protein [Bacteroidia bacterium]
MKHSIKKWAFRLALSGLFFVILLITFILNPSLLYAHKTIVGICNIYHNGPLDSIVLVRLNDAIEISKSSELYDPHLQYDICLDDGSLYPALIRKFIDDDFSATFYNKTVFWGTFSFKDNYGVQDGHKWNLTQSTAHGFIHCQQFNKLGFFKSNPIAGYPSWKWEGYAEYISRKLVPNNSLDSNINKLVQAEKKDTNWIEFPDGTGSTIKFYKRRLLVQFCSEIKKMDFEQILKDTSKENVVMNKMMTWYKMK